MGQISMQIYNKKIVSKNMAIKIACIVLLLSFVAYLVFNKQSLVGTSYELNDWSNSHVTIDKNGKIIVGEMVVDFVNRAGYLMILKAPAFSPECISNDGSSYLNTYYSRKTDYFLVNLKTDQLTGPLSKLEFQDVLKKLKIKEPALNVPNDYYFTDGTYEDWLTKCLNKKRGQSKLNLQPNPRTPTVRRIHGHSAHQGAPYIELMRS